MAGHLLDAGFQLRVHNRTRSKAEALLARGAVWCDTPGETADGADAVVTIVGYPADVEDIYLSPGGLVERASPGAFLIDMTTSTPSLAVRIAAAAVARQLHALDAPVSGGDVGAREARLTIMVGGRAEDFDAVGPLLRSLGTNVVLQGAAGAGQIERARPELLVPTGTGPRERGGRLHLRHTPQVSHLPHQGGRLVVSAHDVGGTEHHPRHGRAKQDQEHGEQTQGSHDRAPPSIIEAALQDRPGPIARRAASDGSIPRSRVWAAHKALRPHRGDARRSILCRHGDGVTG